MKKKKEQQNQILGYLKKNFFKKASNKTDQGKKREYA